jgi:hypothetical protein
MVMGCSISHKPMSDNQVSYSYTFSYTAITFQFSVYLNNT